MKMGIEMMRNTYNRLVPVITLCIVSQFFWASQAQAASLDDISFTALSGDEVEVTLHLSGDVAEPGSFTVVLPSTIPRGLLLIFRVLPATWRTNQSTLALVWRVRSMPLKQAVVLGL